MPERVEDRKLNPQITNITIGKRDLREISIYPLSLKDQIILSDLISDGISAFFEMHPDESSDVSPQFISFCLGIIKKRIGDLADMITGEGEEILEDITNSQLAEIIEIVYHQNYDKPIKNVVGLFGKLPKSTPGRPSQPSVKSMDTNSETSIKRASKREV